MKQRLLAGTSLLALLTWDPVARATPFDFMYTGALQTFVVPSTGTYQILAYGAQGGNGVYGSGGSGAEIGGDFTLTAGEMLQIAVGGAGSSSGSGGGGGGSFVIGPGNTKFVIAGGGGGGGFLTAGGGGLTGAAGGNGGFGGGGINGSGGGAGTAGGGGFLTAGGGGGFSGGGGGGNGSGNPSFNGPGGGGGSFDADLNQILVANFRTGNGEVIITELTAAVPEPASSLALLGTGLAGLAAMRRRRPKN